MLSTDIVTSLAAGLDRSDSKITIDYSDNHVELLVSRRKETTAELLIVLCFLVSVA